MSAKKKTTTKIITKQKIKTKQKSRKNRNKTKIKNKLIPMAIAAKIPTPRFRRVSSKDNEQEIVVSGEDLIIPVPNVQKDVSSDNLIFISFPANPLYWTGTRIAGLARVYQQYRPLKLVVDYIPQVPVTVPGQVIMGTLWNVESKGVSLQQNLMTSDGSQMIQCYQRATSYINLKSSKLPQRYFNIFGDMSSQNCNPFTWVAHYTGTTDSADAVHQPGYIYVKWTYKFTIAIGDRDIPVQSISQEDDISSVVRSKDALTGKGWGIALSALRYLGRALRNTAIFFLRTVAVDILESTGGSEVKKGLKDNPTTSTVIGPGRCYNLDVGSLKTDQLAITDDTGQHYGIQDESVRVCVYAHGEEVEIEPADYCNVNVLRFDWPSTYTYTTELTATSLSYAWVWNSDPNVVIHVVFTFDEKDPDILTGLRTWGSPDLTPSYEFYYSMNDGRNWSKTILAGVGIGWSVDDSDNNIPYYWNREELLEKYPLTNDNQQAKPIDVQNDNENSSKDKSSPKKKRVIVVSDESD